MLALQIAVGIVLGVVALALLYGAVKESRGEPFVFWGLVVIYGGGLVAIWWGLRYLGVI